MVKLNFWNWIVLAFPFEKYDFPFPLYSSKLVEKLMLAFKPPQAKFNFLIMEIYFVCSHAKLIFVRMLSAIDQLSVVLVTKALYSVTPFLLHC
jgi:hypothetical protein